MALVACRECSRQVSDRARVCPHCGIDDPYANKAISRGMRAPGWFSLMALLILLLLFAFSVGVDVNSILILLIILVGSLLSIGFYFLPSLIASNRKHPDRRFIFIVNLFFGLTGIGWIGCLIWALSRDRI